MSKLQRSHIRITIAYTHYVPYDRICPSNDLSITRNAIQGNGGGSNYFYRSEKVFSSPAYRLAREVPTYVHPFYPVIPRPNPRKRGLLNWEGITRQAFRDKI